MIIKLGDRRWLEPGDHPMTVDEIRRSDLILGPPGHLEWDRAWRLHLLGNFETLARQLWSTGIKDVFICGSFVESKDHPDDIDGYFLCDRKDYKTRKLHDRLNQLNELRCWTWRDEHRKPDQHGRPKSPLWHHYRCEIYPYYGEGQCDLVGRDGTVLPVPEFYRRTRCESYQRGIIRLING